MLNAQCSMLNAQLIIMAPFRFKSKGTLQI